MNELGRILAALIRFAVIRPVIRWQAWRCERAKAYLLRHDESYRSQYAGLEIVRRRERLYEAGVSPNDPSIPNRWDIEDELPDRAWPRTPKLLT